ncbi:MAG: SDR family NAD(P)-dependent oxidoreductase [Lachnospiraceae bacterium]|nr:SDR family NAD(P)-dependent oxidoreductase [Lachnospiraceae bacterium]MCI9184676.1 SDR family NAD(P)-dependent oxidoreductase [Lachnospiraceae bacterium]
MARIAMVTGASSGMGKEAVLQIGNNPRKVQEVWVVARRRESLMELKRQVSVPVRIFPLDLAQEKSWHILKRALEKYKPEIKILVNSAGYGKNGKVGSVGLKEEAGMVRLNCEALCAVTHLALPYLADHGRILQMASAAAFVPQPGFAVYAATKAFVLSYSRALGVELKPRGIVVTAVCPGPVATGFFEVAQAGGKLPFYKRAVMAKPKKVVKKALEDSMSGKAVSVYGPAMKGFCLLCKAVPHRFLLRFMEKGGAS